MKIEEIGETPRKVRALKMAPDLQTGGGGLTYAAYTDPDPRKIEKIR